MKLVVTLAGIPIGLEISNATYRFVFEPYITPDRAPVAWIHVPEADLSAARPLYGRESSAAYVEYMELCPLVSDLLLSYRRVIFHSTAFLWHDKAWLLTAASGVGKTTQYIQWKRLYGEDVQILNGDKPILRFEEKSIYVCASPWTGKEGMGQNFEAPLGGILFLKQALSLIHI